MLDVSKHVVDGVGSIFVSLISEHGVFLEIKIAQVKVDDTLTIDNEQNDEEEYIE